MIYSHKHTNFDNFPWHNFQWWSVTERQNIYVVLESEKVENRCVRGISELDCLSANSWVQVFMHLEIPRHVYGWQLAACSRGSCHRQTVLIIFKVMSSQKALLC